MKYIKLFELSFSTWKDAFYRELDRVDKIKIKGGIYTPTRVGKFASKYCYSLLEEIMKIYNNNFICNPTDTKLIKRHDFTIEKNKIDKILPSYIIIQPDYKQIISDFLKIDFLNKKLKKSISKNLISFNFKLFKLDDDYYKLCIFYENVNMTRGEKEKILYFDQLPSVIKFLKSIKSLL